MASGSIISPERAAKIRQLFEEVCELPEANRAEFVDQACREEQSLRNELGSLLRHADSDDSPVDDFAQGIVAPMLEALRDGPAGLSVLLDEAVVHQDGVSGSWVGRQVAHFEIKESIGRGGMGEVYRAFDTKLNRDVAIKVLSDVFTSDRERLTRFEREAKVLASLNHSNIGSIYGLEEADGMKGLVLELVEGPTLADRIKKGPMPINEALDIARQIAEALEAAHEQGIIHRDLKPANVKIRDDGTVKVLDFGLAKVFEANPDGAQPESSTLTAATRPDVIMGTAAYMAPEQAKGEPVDKRSDIWGFGCVLYEMLAGRRAFEGQSVSEIMAGVIKGEPDWDALPTGLSPVLVSFLRRCLEKDSRERIRDIGDVRLSLLGAFDVAAAPTAQIHVWQRPIPVVVGGLVLIAVIGVVVWALMKGGQSVTFPTTTRLTITLFEEQGFSGPGGALAVSPDGLTVVYRAEVGEGRFQLFQRRIDQFESVPMPDTENARELSFSPDGLWVGFSSKGVIRKVALAGGLSQKIADVRASRGLNWGDDDTILLGGASRGLVQIPAAGGEPKVILEAKVYPGGSGAGLWYPQRVKGTGAILFTHGDFVRGVFELQILLPETGERRTVLHNASAGRLVDTGHLVFVRSGALWAVPFDRERLEVVGSPVTVVEGVRVTIGGVAHYAIADAGSLVYEPGPIGHPQEARLVLLDRQGNEEALPLPPNRYNYDMKFSPDGTRLAFRILHEDGSDLFIYDFSTKRLSPLTFDGSETFVWTPDGRHITYIVKDAIWNIAADFSGEPRLLSALPEDTEILRPLSWSPDGRVLLLVKRANGPNGSLVRLFVLENGEVEYGPPNEEISLRVFQSSLSANGRWLSFPAGGEPGQRGVYVQPFPPGTGPKRRIAEGVYGVPQWSRNDRELIYTSRNGEIWSVAIETEPTLSWKDPVLLFDLPRSFIPGWFPRYNASPDGQRFVFLKRPGIRDTREIRIVLNWFEELKEKVPIP